MAADGSIVFETRIDNAEAQKDLNALEKSIARIEKDISKMEGEKSGLEEQFRRAGDALAESELKLKTMKDELQQAKAVLADTPGFDLPLEEYIRYSDLVSSLPAKIAEQEREYQRLGADTDKLSAKLADYDDKIAAATDELARQQGEAGKLVKEVSDGSDAFDEIKESAEVADQTIVDMTKELEELKEKLNELKKRGIGMGYKEYDETLEKVHQLTAALKEYQNQKEGKGTARQTKGASTAPKSGSRDTSRSDKAYAKLQSILSKVSQAARTAGAALAKVGSTAARAFTGAAKAAAGFLRQMNVFSRMSERLSGTFKRLGGLIKGAFVFNVISQGLTALKGQVASYLSTNAQFTAALNNLKGTLAGAFQPILNVAVPALITLINVISQVIAAIGRFIGALFSIGGKSKSNVKAMNAEAAAIGGAGAAAEEAAKSLASFDEINKLASDTGGGGGGGGGGAGEVEIPEYDFESEFSSWGEAFDAFLDTIINEGIPKLKSAFSTFADWMEEISTKLYEMFTFPGVKEKVRTIGIELANAFNQLIDEMPWEMMGKALGAGLNLAFILLTEWIYGMHWKDLGNGIARLINNAIKEIEWENVGKLLWAGFKIGIETLAGLIAELEMPEVARALGDMIKGFFNAALETVKEIPWAKIGEQIAIFLNEFDWYGVITSVLKTIIAALDGLKQAIDTFLATWNWQDTAQQIYSAINNAIQGIDWAGLGETLGRLFSTVLGFLLKAIGGVDWVGIGRGLATAINGIFAAIDWAVLGQNLGNALISILNGLREFIAKVDWAAIGQDVATFLMNIDWKSLLISLGGLIGDALVGALDAMVGFAQNFDYMGTAKAIYDGLIEAVTGWDWSGIISDIFYMLGVFLANQVAAPLALAQSVWEHIADALSSAWEDITDKIEECGGNVVEGIFKGILEAITGVRDWIYNNIFMPFINGFKSVFGIHSPSTVMEEQGGFIIAGLLQGLTKAWGTITTFFSEKLEAVKETIGKAWEAIKKTTKDIWDKVTAALSETWDSIKNFAKEKFEAAKEAISTAWENVKTTTSQVWENIKSTLSTTWTTIRTAASEKFNEIKSKITTAWENTKQATSEKWQAIKTTLGNTWQSLQTSAATKFNEIKSKISTAWENTKTATVQKWNSISSDLSSKWSDIKKAGVDTFTALKNAVAGIFNSLGDSIRGAVNTIIGYIESMANKVVDGINTVIRAINSINIAGFSFNIPQLGTISIPRLATGAVIPPNREFMAVLGDQRSGNNIEAPESLIRKIVREESGGGNTELLQAILEAIRAGQVIMVDRQVLGRVVTREQNRTTRASGRSSVLT